MGWCSAVQVAVRSVRPVPWGSLGGARSLPRLRARGVAVVMAVAVGHAARDARNARRASRIRMCASSPRIAHVTTAPFPDVNHARARHSLARSLICCCVRRHAARARVI